MTLGAAALGGWLYHAKQAHLHRQAHAAFPLLRPPGALDEPDFLARCIRCQRCSQACPNDTIRFCDADQGPATQGTPFIRPSEQGCILCMKCTQACPTGALTPLADDAETLLAHVRIGVAQVDRVLCNSYNGYACGACVMACPFEGLALRVGTWERPVVDPSHCVGCGLCEQQCIHYPKAIRVTRRDPNQAPRPLPVGHPRDAAGGAT